MIIYLKDFVLKIAEEHEMKLLSYTKDAIRDAERELEKNHDIAVEDIIAMLKKKDELRKGFTSNDWERIEKEIKKMIK